MWLLVGKNLLSVVDFLPKIILYVPNIMLPKKVFLTKYHGVQKIISRDMIQKYHFVSWYKNTMSWYKIIILYFPNIMLPKKKGNLVDSEKILRSSADGLTRGVKSLLRRVSDFRPTLLLLVASGLLLNCLFRCSVGMLFACFRHSWRNSGISSHASLLPHFRFL